MAKKVEILDSIMGSNKTNRVLDWIDSNPNERYLYISPLLSEVDNTSRLATNLKHVKEDWFYDCFCEFQKRAGVRNSQFFTPTKTAERIAEIVFEYAEFDERILDACCGFGQITKALKNKGYEQIEAFDNDKQMSDAYFDLTGIDARVFDFNNEDNFANKYNLIVSNPPYEVKDLTKFLEFVDEHLNETGKAILLIPSVFDNSRKNDFGSAAL